MVNGGIGNKIKRGKKTFGYPKIINLSQFFIVHTSIHYLDKTIIIDYEITMKSEYFAKVINIPFLFKI